MRKNTPRIESIKSNYIGFLIPKAGSSSLHKTLGRYTEISYCSGRGIHNKLNDNISMLYDFKNMQNAFKFAVCRNPWDRLVSFYHSSQYQRSRIFPYAKHFKTFDSFIKDYINKVDVASDNTDGHYRLQTNFINLDTLDFLARFENYETHVNFICAKINIPKLSIHSNKSKHRPYQEYYDKKTRDIVIRKYKKDIDLLEYTFGE